MSLMQAKGRQTTAVEWQSEGADVLVRAMRDGSLITNNFLQAAIAQGLGYFIQVGALTTPIVGGGNGTILDLDQPEVNIGVPANTVIMPFRVHVQAELPADTDGDIEEIVIGYDRLASNTGGTFTDETVYNLKTDASVSSTCDPNSAYTVNQTTEPTVIELARAQKVMNVLTSGITQGQFELLYEPAVVPMIVGPAQLLVYWGGVAAMSAFAQVYWVEFPKAYFG